MSEFSYKNDDQADERLNPAEIQNRESNSGGDPQADSEKNALNQNYNSSNDSDTTKESLNKTTSDNGYYNQSAGVSNPSSSGGIRGVGRFLKRRSAVATITALFVGGIGGLMLLLSPSLAAVQLKEALVGDLNDQLGAMDLRTNHVFRAKLNDIGKGSCTGVKVRCGFKGMSDRQVKRFQAAGWEVETNGKTTFGKNKVVSLSITDSSGKKITIDNPKQLNKLVGDAVVRRAVKRAFDPRFYGFFDAVSDKVFTGLKTNKANKVVGDTDADRDKSFNSAMEGEPNGVRVVSGTAGDEETQAEKDRRAAAEEQAKRLNSGGESTGSLFNSVAKNGVKNAVKGLGILAAADVACSVKNTARAVSAGAKYYREVQLARYFMVYASGIDQLVAGEAEPDTTNYLFNKLAEIDNRAKVVDETSVQIDSNGTVKAIDNPDFGKNAYDSQGVKVAMYNEAPNLTARSMQYTIGGGAVMGTLSKINEYIEKYAQGDKCKFIQNNAVRVGSLVFGIVIGAVTLGGSLAIQVGASVAIGMAIPILENYLAQMLAGNVADASTSGVDAGNAMFAGAGALMGRMAMGRGMQPASISRMKNYIRSTSEVKNDYIAMETEAAKATPFDVMNQYSFLGSLVRKISPPLQKGSQSLGITLGRGLSIFGTASNVFIPNASAASEFNEDRFTKCKDYGYEELGIDADVFCNVRYTMSAYELSLDTDTVRNYMYVNGYVDAEGEPIGEYADFIEQCTSRERGWGESPEGVENGEKGEDCIDDRSKWPNRLLSYFRVYTMDDSIIEAMDYVPPTTLSLAAAGTGQMRIGTYNVKVANQTNGPGDGWLDSSVRMPMIGKIIREKLDYDVVGLQEIEAVQWKQVKDALPGYSSFPKAYRSEKGLSGQVPIYWKTDKFGTTPVDSGLFNRSWRKCTGVSLCEYAPWVLLEDANGEQFYVMNTHMVNENNIAGGSDTGGAEKREADAKEINRVIRTEFKRGVPVFVTGDLNSSWSPVADDFALRGDRTRLPYCILTTDTGISHVSDIADGLKGACPTKLGQRKYQIDHVFTNSNTPVQKVGRYNDSQATDHPTIYADIGVDIGGKSGSDIVGDDYKRECSKYLKSGNYCPGNRYGNQCTAFVHFRLVKHGVIKELGISGSGGEIVASLGRLGYKVNSTPAVHAVMSTFATSDPSNGHTAMVSQVNNDGSIIVEEYNFAKPLKYTQRLITKAEIVAKNITFAHTEVDYK